MAIITLGPDEAHERFRTTSQGWDTEPALVWNGTEYVRENEIQKAYKRQFATRSEAGRYAARARWGNRNANDPVTELKGMIDDLTAKFSAYTDDDLEDAEKDIPVVGVAGYSESNALLCELNSEFPDLMMVVPGPKAFELEGAATAVGVKALAVVDSRLAAKGITEQSVKERRDQLAQEIGAASQAAQTTYQTHPYSPYQRWRQERALREGTITKDEFDAGVKSWTKDKKKVDKDVKDAKAKLEAPENNYRVARALETQALIADVKGTGVRPDFSVVKGKGATRMDEPIVDGISKVFPASVVQDSNSKGKKTLLVLGPEGGGGSYTRRGDMIDVGIDAKTVKVISKTKEGAFASVGVHEYGHKVSFEVPAVRIAEQAFYHRRTRGVDNGTTNPTDIMRTIQEPGLRALNLPNVVVRPDKFADVYSGRTYEPNVRNNLSKDPTSRVMGTRHFYPTETFSTGVESILGTSMDALRQDNDHKAFALGVILGLP